MFAKRIENLVESPVREILKVIDRPGMISFAGGLPATECFPALDLSCVDSEHLQYGPSEGESELREQVAASLIERGLQTTPERVLILSGSQQGIDLVAKLFVDRGTNVAVEAPTYLAALQVFDLFGAEYIPYTADQPKIGNSRLTYTIPTFQNPTGHCYSEEQRRALALACDRSGSVLFEDDPYRDLVYGECDRTPVCSYVRDTEWIYQSSFSKAYAPGLRLGYLTCSKKLFPHLVRLKQAADLHSCRVSQRLILQLLQLNDDRNQTLTTFYRRRRDSFDLSLTSAFSGIADWQQPVGGLFYWLTLRPEFAIDTRELLKQAIEAGVAFMPGESFYPRGVKALPSLRLNFSHASPEEAAHGLRTLAGIIRTACESRV